MQIKKSPFPTTREKKKEEKYCSNWEEIMSNWNHLMLLVMMMDEVGYDFMNIYIYPLIYMCMVTHQEIRDQIENHENMGKTTNVP